MLLAGVLVVLALAVMGNRRLDKRLYASSGAALLLVLVWFGVSRLVETPREAALGGTRAFVAAVVQRDTQVLTDLLAPAATLGAFNREDIAQSATIYAEEFGLKGALITGSEVEERGTQVNCTIRVISTHEAGRRGAPDTMPSDWQFTWGRLPDSEGGGWRIVQITPIRIGSQEVSGIVSRFFTRRPTN
jgi:hypothetical protein